LSLSLVVFVEEGPGCLELERQLAHAVWNVVVWLADAQAKKRVRRSSGTRTSWLSPGDPAPDGR
jgi:hypothetical protein